MLLSDALTEARIEVGLSFEEFEKMFKVAPPAELADDGYASAGYEQDIGHEDVPSYEASFDRDERGLVI